MADKRRLLTLVGPAGIGKTSVAIAVAERLIGTYADGVWLIDLAPVADPHLVPTALASVMGLETRSDSPLPTLISALRDMQTLLVFDNCEHVIEPAAALAALALKGSPGVRIIATSREPLRAEGEWVHRLGALESPPVSPRITATEALRFAAVQLFAERAAATTNDFELSDTNAPSACEICHKLDGIPLAIELAAGRVDMFGVRGLAARLDGRSRLLAFGRRGPLSRHRTLGAALDWSHQLLNQEEQTILRRLAIFAGGFTLASASAVAAGTDQNLSDITDTVESLVMKSLVEANVGEREVRFRLLETTRVFALAKLAESGEADELAHRHAAYFRDLLHARSSSPEGSDSISATAPEIDKFVPHSRGLLRRGAIDRLPLH